MSAAKRARALHQLPAKPHLVYSDAFVRVVSDTPMTQAQGQALGKMITDAFNYDTRVEQWNQPGKLQAPLTVQALSPSGFDRALGGSSAGIAGVTLDGSTMAVPVSLVSTATPDDLDTLAHEANHVQDFREAGDHLDKIPSFLQEGKAYVLGDSYPIFLKSDAQDAELPDIAKSLGSYTAADARHVMQHYVTPQDSDHAGNDGYKDELLGALFVEYLRTRLGGTGLPDAVQRLAHMTEAVGGGASFETAFRNQFHASSKDVETAFVDYVKTTEHQPAKRLAGTLWEPYLPGTPTPNS